MDFNLTEEEKKIAMEQGPAPAATAYHRRTNVAVLEAKKIVETQCPDAWKALRARREAERQREREELEKFKQELFSELGVQDNPKRELLWDHAWDRGHAAGLYEVKMVAEDLVDLIL